MAEIDALIVRNIKELDLAASRLRNEIESQVGHAINMTVETWVNKEKWAGLFDWYGKKNIIWIAAPSWRGENIKDNHDYEFWFSLAPSEGHNFADNSNGNHFWLTSLCHIGKTEIGFRSCQDIYKYPQGRKWKSKVEPFIKDLSELDFKYENTSGQFFLPIRIDHDRLAHAIDCDDIIKALDPIIIALDKMIIAKPIIDQLRASAKDLD